MKLEDIKIGMKVKLLSKHGCGDNYNDIESWYDNRKRYDSVKFIKEQGYGVVEKICRDNEIYIKYCFDSTLCGWYFTANDLEPYEEPKTINIETLFDIGDKCYTVKKANVKETCSLCIGSGKVELKNNDVEYACPECHGNGYLFLNKKIYIPVDDKVSIDKIRISINKNDTIIKYTVQHGTNKYNRETEKLFKTLEEAQKWCDEANKQKEVININDIIISKSFEQTKPNTDKFKEKLDYFNKNGKFNKNIIINKHFVLVDGYINYLIAKMYGINSIECIVED